ncbi:MAG TPA: TIR domain-containing protein, partial [Candidatus Deferrimicrobium sp.]|nr:TIR domain-containing protein [Candidatus Deferrimicrobium sp.]
MKYQAFISYKHSDFSRRKVIAVENALKKYAKPFWKPSIKLFRDEKEMATGSKLGASINHALECSEYLIYFASKEAARSEWVQKELRKWCGELNRTDKLIIILIEDEIKTDSQKEKIIWEESDALPSFLEEYITDIPIYEDLRWSKQDELLTLGNIPFRESINKITGRLQKKTPAEMNDENVKIDRRNKRIIKISIGIFVSLFVISIIATLVAVVQKNLADEQYKEAVKQTQKAIEEKKRADEQTKEALKQRNIATQNEQKALEEKNRADEQYKMSVSNRLASEAELVLPRDHKKAIRIAEMAY